MNRRNLLKTTGLAALGSVLMPSTLMASYAKQESNGKIIM